MKNIFEIISSVSTSSIDVAATPLFIASCILIVGFIGSVLMNRYGLPDNMFLLFIGMILGPISGLILSNPILNADDFINIAPIVGSLALVAIMFESSLEMNLYEIVRGAKHALILAGMVFFASSIIVTIVIHQFIFTESWMSSLLFGLIVGGSSGSVVIPIASKVGLGPTLRIVLTLESIMTDAFGIIFATAMLMIMTAVSITGEITALTDIASFIAGKFSISIVLGFLYGLFLSSLLYRVKRERHVYTLTFASLLLLYSTTEFIGGTGAVSVLTAGLILTNLENIPIIAASKEKIETIQFLRVFLESFHSELTLLIRVFFFVVIGLLINLSNPITLLWAAGISLLLLLIRYPIAIIISKMLNMRPSAPIITVFYARGLVAAVLGLQAFMLINDPFITETVSGIILITNIILTVAYFVIKSRGSTTTPIGF